MDKLEEKPIYQILLDEEKTTGVFAISLVDSPAISVNFVALDDKSTKKVEMKKDSIKYTLTGPALIPNQLILRSDKEKGEYYITYTEEVIEKISQRFLSNKFQDNTTHQHLLPLSNNVVVESWIIGDSQHDKSKVLGFDLPVGTWMMTVKVNDKDYWQKFVETGVVKGFSIEGFFKEQLQEDIKMKSEYIEEKDVPAEVERIKKAILRDNPGMSIGQAFAIAWTVYKDKMGMSDEINENSDPNGSKYPVEKPTGTKKRKGLKNMLKNLLSIANQVLKMSSNPAKVEDNKSVKLEEQKEPETIKMGSMKNSEGVDVYFDGETVAVGALVYLIDDAGEKQAIPAGEYPMEDGTTWVIDENSMLIEIKPVAQASAVKESSELETLKSENLALKEKLDKFEKQMQTLINQSKLKKDLIEIKEQKNDQMKKVELKSNEITASMILEGIEELENRKNSKGSAR